jgi:hypothetical protein
VYEAFYGFREKPFSIIPDPGSFTSAQHSMALSAGVRSDEPGWLQCHHGKSVPARRP